MNAEGYTFETATHALFELERMLNERGITIAPGSMFEAAAYSTLRIAERTADPALDLRIQTTHMVGVTELAHQLRRNQNDPKLDALLPHLALLAEGAAVQVGSSSVLDQATNKLFELLVACWILPLASEIALDDPKASSNGMNPDILATVAGVKWGIPCKVLHSRTPQQWLSTVKKAVEQIEASSAERGVVMLNMRNHLDLNVYWPLLDPTSRESNPEYAAFGDESRPFKILREQLAGVATSAKAAAGQDALEAILLKPRIMPAVAMWGHTLSPVVLNGAPVIASVRTLVVTNASDDPKKSITASDRSFLEAVNRNALSNPQ
ncbi:MAG: hypothetical protein QM723_27625 [Myxococcaceae bacterium]